MIITCPNCETRFNVEPAHLLPNGRTVRCGKCSHLWTERPPGDMPRRVDGPTISLDDLPSMAEDVDDVANFFEQQLQPSAANDGRRSASGQAIGWGILVLVVVGVLGASVLARNTLVAWWPPSQALFELAGLSGEKIGKGLEIRNVTYTHKIEDDKPTLVIAGEVVNTTSQPIDIPELRGSLLDTRQREVYAWVFSPKQERLQPGQVMMFDSSIREPPSTARQIAVTFAK